MSKKRRRGKKAGGTPTEQKLREWVEARRRHQLSHCQVQMARELGLNPRKLRQLDNHDQEPWKAPLPQFIEQLYLERFGRERPEEVLSIEERARRERAKRERKREAKARRRAAAGAGAAGTEADGLVQRYVEVKRALVRYVQRHYREAILEQARRRGGDEEVTEAAVTQATEALINAVPADGDQDPIDCFLADHPRLSADERALARGFRDQVTGVFQVLRAEGRIFEARNLVDALDYRLVLSSDDPEVWRALEDAVYFASGVVPLAEGLWTLSGTQTLLGPDNPQLVRGTAAELATRYPRLFFRNPRHLETARAALRRQHDEFVRRFGGAWVVGPPEEIQELHRQLIAGRLEGPGSGWLQPELQDVAQAQRRRLRDYELPEELMTAESVGMISHPAVGLCFLRDFGRFLAAFEENAAFGAQQREVVTRYLEDDSIDPEVLEIVAGARPEAATRLFRRVLDHPTFEWARDSEALLRRYKSAHLARERLPSLIRLPDDLLEGWLALKRARESGAPQ